MTLLYRGMGPPLVTEHDSPVTTIDAPDIAPIADEPTKQNSMESAHQDRDQIAADAKVGTHVQTRKERSPLFDPSATDNQIVNGQVSSAGVGAARELAVGHGPGKLPSTQAIGPLIDDGTALGGLYHVADQRGINDIVGDRDGVKPPLNQGNDVARDKWAKQAANSARAAFDQSRSLYSDMRMG